MRSRPQVYSKGRLGCLQCHRQDRMCLLTNKCNACDFMRVAARPTSGLFWTACRFVNATQRRPNPGTGSFTPIFPQGEAQHATVHCRFISASGGTNTAPRYLGWAVCEAFVIAN